MDTADNVARAARNLITEHGTASESIALARAKSAEETDREEVANTWRDIADAVREMQRRRDR
jgi:hypothetical protein